MDEGWNFDTEFDGGFGNPGQNSQNQQLQNGYNDYGDFMNNGNDNQLQTADSANESSNKKTSIIIIAAGIVLFLIILLIIRGINSSKDKSTPSNNQIQLSDSNISTTSSSNSGWVAIKDNEKVKFDANYTTLQFTITGINHYAKKVGSDDLMIKTTLTGALSGLPGTYELDIPYSKGTQVRIGNHFNVQVKFGEYNSTRVVEEIKY